MAIDWGQVAAFAGTGLGSAAVTVVGGLKWIKKSVTESAASGARNTLNGTAEAVKGLVVSVGRLESGQQRQEAKLDHHISDTGDRFDKIGQQLADTREDVAYLKGQQNTPKRAMRRTPRSS